MLLEHVKNVSSEVDEDLENKFQELSESINSILNELDDELGMRPDSSGERMPRPGMADRDPMGDKVDPLDPEAIMGAMETVMKQMDAAKRAMQILNKMADSPSRTRNKSRVMGNLNKIRGSLQRIQKMMGDDGEAMPDEARGRRREQAMGHQSMGSVDLDKERFD